jgi:hypothetical protein
MQINANLFGILLDLENFLTLKKANLFVFSSLNRNFALPLSTDMRQIYVFLILLGAFCGCTGGGKYEEMRQRLQALNAMNRADSVLTATERDEAQALADYFDSHGTPNDQLLAHYLLGRCYALAKAYKYSCYNGSKKNY